MNDYTLNDCCHIFFFFCNASPNYVCNRLNRKKIIIDEKAYKTKIIFLEKTTFICKNNDFLYIVDVSRSEERYQVQPRGGLHFVDSPPDPNAEKKRTLVSIILQVTSTKDDTMGEITTSEKAKTTGKTKTRDTSLCQF